jgi:hypothetical protein
MCIRDRFKTTITKIMDKLVNIHIENLYKNGDKVINIPKLVSDIKELNEYLVSIDHGFNKNISVDSKISIKDVNKIHQKTKFSENISILNKLEKYSSTRFNSTKYKKKLLLHSPVDVVRGGKKTRKNRKAMHVS